MSSHDIAGEIVRGFGRMSLQASLSFILIPVMFILLRLGLKFRKNLDYCFSYFESSKFVYDNDLIGRDKLNKERLIYIINVYFQILLLF